MHTVLGVEDREALRLFGLHVYVSSLKGALLSTKRLCPQEVEEAFSKLRHQVRT